MKHHPIQTTLLGALCMAAALLPGSLSAQATSRNVAIGSTIAAYSSRIDSSYGPNRIIDGIKGNTGNYWGAYGYPQWVEIDLGSDCVISKTILHLYDMRAYKFKVEARQQNGAYTTVVDRLNNQTVAPVTDEFAPVAARFVKLTITGVYNNTGAWMAIQEFEIHGIPQLTQDMNVHIKGITRIDGGLDLVGQGLAIYATKEEYETGGQPVFEVTADGTMFVKPQGDISMGPYGAND